MGLFDIFSSKPAEDAAQKRIAGLNAGYGQASDLYGQGRNALQSNFTAAAQPFQTLFNQSQGGSDAYGDATGANGPEGQARARANFQSSPGFDFQLNTGVDALSRAGAAKGVATGNVLRDAQTYGTGLAQQDWGNYVNRLQPYLGAGQGAAGGVANALTGLGSGLNANLTGQGGLGFQTQTGIGDANASADLAKYNASGNLWGALLGLGNLGAKFGGFGSLGGGSGPGGGGSSGGGFGLR
jgi:hypothetical protein